MNFKKAVKANQQFANQVKPSTVKAPWQHAIYKTQEHPIAVYPLFKGSALKQ